MTAELMTTTDLASRLRCSNWKVLKEAKRLGIGANLGGRAGYRFSETDLAAIQTALTPPPAVPRRRRRGRSS